MFFSSYLGLHIVDNSACRKEHLKTYLDVTNIEVEPGERDTQFQLKGFKVDSIDGRDFSSKIPF